MGEPPTPGPVGTVPGDSAATPPAPTEGCTLAITPSTQGGSSIWAQASGCSGDTVVLVVTGAGQQRDVALPGFAGEVDLPYDLNPCAFGLAGNAPIDVTYVVKVVAGPDAGKTSAQYSGTRQPSFYDRPPSVSVSGTPRVGDLVLPGDQITLQVSATDDRHVSRIMVTADPGSTLTDETFAVGPPRCSNNDDRETVTVKTYVVPENPPEFITFTATVTDSQGQPQGVVVQYPTRGVWYGDIHGTTTDVGPSFSCAGSFRGLIRVVVESPATSGKPVTVSGDAIATASVGGCQFPPNFPSTGDVTFTLTGTFDGKVFDLQLAPSGIENQAGWAVGMHLFSYPAPSLPIIVTRSGSQAGGHFHRENSGPEELAGGGATATLDGQVDMSCCAPNVEPVVPATRRPLFLGEDD
jgi:hypothetical protein